MTLALDKACSSGQVFLRLGWHFVVESAVLMKGILYNRTKESVLAPTRYTDVGFSRNYNRCNGQSPIIGQVPIMIESQKTGVKLTCSPGFHL
jgi:hypothetical protein